MYVHRPLSLGATGLRDFAFHKSLSPDISAAGHPSIPLMA